MYELERRTKRIGLVGNREVLNLPWLPALPDNLPESSVDTPRMVLDAL